MINMPATWTLSIVSHGHRDNIKTLLTTLATLLPSQAFCVVITSNCGERFDDLASIWPGKLKLIYNEAVKSYAANHNAALQSANTDFVAMVDPDLALTASPFEALAEVLTDMPRGSIAAPLVLEPTGGRADNTRELPTPLRIVKRIAIKRPAEKADWLAGLFLAMSTESFSQLGGFDTRYRMYCEDVDLCLRAQLAGGQLLLADRASVIHPARRQSRRHWRYFIWHLTSLLKLWSSKSYRNYKHKMPA